MKSKSLTYFLIAGVMAIWGIVFYRIYHSVAKEESTPMHYPTHRGAVANAEVADNYELLANYRDPFLGNLAVERKNKSAVKKSPVKVKAPEVLIDWTFIVYNGTVYNKEAKRKITLMNVRGENFMLNEKEKAGEVTLLKNLGDSILVAYLGKTKYIALPLNR